MTKSTLHNHPPNMATTTCPECLKDGELSRQRSQRGYSDEDVWNLNTYLAGVIAGAVEQLADEMHGCPADLVEDGDIDAACGEWKVTLKEIAQGFRMWQESDERFDDPPPEFDRAFELLHKWWGGLWD